MRWTIVWLFVNSTAEFICTRPGLLRGADIGSWQLQQPHHTVDAYLFVAASAMAANTTVRRCEDRSNRSMGALVLKPPCLVAPLVPLSRSVMHPHGPGTKHISHKLPPTAVCQQGVHGSHSHMGVYCVGPLLSVPTPFFLMRHVSVPSPKPTKFSQTCRINPPNLRKQVRELGPSMPSRVKYIPSAPPRRRLP